MSATVTVQQKRLMELRGETKHGKGERIIRQESRVSDLEQYSRVNDVIIGGPRIIHLSSAAAGHEVASSPAEQQAGQRCERRGHL